MAQTCNRCSRVNPPEAAYCYFDGNLLAGHTPAGRTPAAGSAGFANPFVFPKGRSCRNFDELALAIQNDWNAGKLVVQQGILESFLSTLGRADLAIAAREASRYPDRDRGLDQLLAKLPTSALQPPKLQVERGEINLGTIKVGEDHQLDLRLENLGMRLIYGSISCGDCLWLSLGDAPGAPQKVFQFGADASIPVHVRGKHLRAGNKPLEGQLVIESSGGNRTISVKAEVPVKPFATGVLAGARSPRQVAEKAKGAPKEAAKLFEKGAVARWYEENGWKYPVQGPASSGLGAVQQFFEALGLTPPPKVDISERSVALQGNPGDMLKHALEVKAQEKRPVYAHASSNQPWLEVGRARLNGRTATIPLVISAVPDREGETLTAKVLVVSNGNQRFVVPVTLTVGGSLNFGAPAPVASVLDYQPEVQAVSAPQPLPAPAVLPVYAASRGLSIHSLPALLLALALLGIIAWDAVAPKPKEEPPAKSTGVTGRAAPYGDLQDKEPYLGIQFNERKRFGLVMTKVNDPKEPGRHKRLTFEETGGTNNTIVKIDGSFENYFGNRIPGKWKVEEQKLKDRHGWRSVMDFPDQQILVTQTVELLPGAQTRVLDTCLVTYDVENYSKTSHKVGLRIMLDTYIGANDGVPFAIPGQKGLLKTNKDFPQKDIPDFIQALENEDLDNPGTVAHMGLKLPSEEYEPILRMIVTRYPGNSETRWEVPLAAMNEPPDAPKDSCVVLYWAEQQMAPGEKRKMGFTYGLNKISSMGKANSQLSITVGGQFRPKKEFTVTAYVKNSKQGQKVKLTLPKGLSLVPGQNLEQEIDATAALSQVSWRVTAGAAGEFELSVKSGVEQEGYRIEIRDSGIFGK